MIGPTDLLHSIGGITFGKEIMYPEVMQLIMMLI